MIVIHRFSLVKAAMNAPRICKFCNGVNKTPPFLHFPSVKGGIRTIAHLSILERLSVRSLDRHIGCGSWNQVQRSVLFFKFILLLQGARGIAARFLKWFPASTVCPIMTKFSQYTPYSTCYLVLVFICRQD